MKTKYKYIYFEKVDGQWCCFNNKSGCALGWIQYYRKWKLYVIEFEPGCVFNNTCLTDISHFLRQLQGGESKAKKIGKE